MTQIRLEVLNPKGIVVSSLVSQDGTIISIEGPIIGAHGFTYNQQGTVLDKIGDASFTVPLHVARNDALAAGNHVKLYEDGIEVSHNIITTNSENLTASGREAQFTCPDLMDELRRTTVTSGFVADIGHINSGPSDPIPTRAAETFMQVFNRLLGVRYGVTGDSVTAWAAGDIATIPVGLDGLEFGVYGVSIVEAIGAFAQGRFCHYKRGNGRQVSIGRFGTSSGIRLVASGTPWDASTNDEIRLITGYTREWDGNYVNDIVPRGSGNNATQLTLRTLYPGNTNATDPTSVGNRIVTPDGHFTGFDPRFPIKRRVRWDFGEDGYEYYIDTSGYSDSIARYGLSMAIYDVNNIAPTTPAENDLQLAAATLYQAAVAHLQWYSQPHETFTITTEGRGNLTDIGGKTVRVVYTETNKNGVTIREINKDYFVMEVKRAWSDAGAATDTWTLSSIGRYAEDGFTIFSGALQQLDYFRLTPTIFPTRESIYYDALVAPSYPATIYLDQDQSVVRMVEATFHITCLPAVAPVTSTALSSTAGAHYHRIIGGLPTDSNTAGNIDHGAPPSQYAHGHGSGTTQGVQSITANGGQFSHAHGSSTVATGGGNVNNSGGVAGLDAHTHGIFIQGGGTPDPNSTGGYVYIQNSDNQLRATKFVQKIASTNSSDRFTTDHGHGSSVNATGGGNVDGNANGGYTPTTNGYQGLKPGVDAGATSASGGGYTPSIYTHGVIPTYGISDSNPYLITDYVTSTDGAHVHLMSYGYYQDPAGRSSGITINVNGVRVDTKFAGTGYAQGPYNVSATVDLAAIGVIPTQGAVQIDFMSATFGRLMIRGKIRRHETTVATHS